MNQTDFISSLRQSIEIPVDHVIAGRLHFKWLPDYALFLQKNRIEELAREQFELSRQLNIPLLSYFSHLPEEQLVELSAHYLRKILDALSSNQASHYIEQSVLNLVNNKIPELSRNQISPEDISLLSFIRCKIFRDSLPFYTKDLELGIWLMEEMNTFTSAMDLVSIRTILNMQQELSEQAQRIAHIGNWSLDLTTKGISWSNELFRIYELEPQRQNTYDLASFTHPDDAAFVTEQMRISAETGQPHDFYYRIVLGNGKEKYLHAMGQVLKAKDGRADKMFGTLQDVTMQKKMEKEWRENEYFIQKITELTPSLISVYHIKTGKYLFINQAIQTRLGYSVEEVLEKGIEFFMNIVHPEDLSRVISENEEALQIANNNYNPSIPEEIRLFKYRMRHADGKYRWFHTFGTVFERNAENQVEKVINVSIDVTQQMSADNKLIQISEEMRKQEDRHYKMINEVEDYAILLLSPDGIIENWNAGAEKIKGYKSQEIIGKNFRIFYPPEDKENKVPETFIQEAIQNGRASHEGWRVRKDNSRFWGSVVITALHDHHGNITGFTKVTRDLTQRKLAEDNLKLYAKTLELKNEELEQKNKDLESFSYIASHDLQEPVRKIQIWTNRIEETEGIPEIIRDSLARIQKASLRMQKLIQGVLQYSQTDLVQVPRELTDLDQVLDEVLNDLSETIEENKIQIERDPLPVLNLVRLQFVQLFSNIISNAIKYRKENHPLHLKISCSLEKGDGGLTAGKNAFYNISIADNGIGFLQEYADKMFELFRRLESGSGYSGTGIGLAICQKIVKNHKGMITATGVPGKGASFEIRLPVD